LTLDMQIEDMRRGYNYLVELNSGVCLFGTYERKIGSYRQIQGPLACFVPGIFHPDHVMYVTEFNPIDRVQVEKEWLKANDLDT